MSEKTPLVSIQDLSISFHNKKVVNDISFTIQKGEILGLVGESGSGKSITSLAMMGLLPKNAQTSGHIRLNSNHKTQDILSLNPEELRKIRGKNISMIFQEPMTSLNPSMRCGEQVAEAILIHSKLTQKEAKKKVLELFNKVLLPQPERIYSSYPHQLSGGQKQRVMIAMALSSNPDLLIADEPTTALDVTVQKAILNLLKKLQKEMDMSVLFISHDLGVIAEICDRVVVMYKGDIVEKGSVKEVFNHPKENYTKGLIACRPKLDTDYKRLPTVQDFIKDPNYKPPLENPQEEKEFYESTYAKDPILTVNNLSKYFYSNKGLFKKEEKVVKAVDEMSFNMYKGETLGLVGESGSGKTTLSRTLLLLEKPTEGEIFYLGKDLIKLSKSEIRALRKDLQIIFQDPYSSLNPRYKVREILIEPMRVHNIGKSDKERTERAIEILHKVDLPKESMDKYPHEFSGGQRQRIGIARALSLNPKIIICDESVSALDVSVQAQVLNLLNDLKDEFDFTYLFISHDLSVVKFMSDRLIVMRHGKMVEYGVAEDIYQHPSSHYTRELINAIPKY